MGTGSFTFYASSSESKGSEDEEKFLPGTQDFATDSRSPDDAPIVPVIPYKFTLGDLIVYIEKQLEFYEKISLVYLLYDDPGTTFDHLQNLQQYQNTKVLTEWYKMFKQTDKWGIKLLEALALIQNYQILSTLGHTLLEVEAKFLTYNENTSVISGIKRNLYRVCNNLNKEQTERLLFNVSRDFHTRRITFEEFSPKYLELYITYWMTIKYISLKDVTNLYQTLIAIDEHELAISLKLFTSNEEIRYVNDSNNEFSTMQEEIQNDTCYPVDSKCPGICLIINQENFHTNFEESVKDRLPPGYKNKQLEIRQGTQKDCNRLHDTFKKFGFTVIVEHDLTHEEMEEKIPKVVKMVTNQSSLIICILSHGTEGAVYGADSVAVEISDIRQFMCTNTNPNLKEKPKILILQSCQGSSFQTLTTDGEGDNELIQKDKHTGITPQTCDMLVFSATVPGFASLRSPKDGSCFIQSLCETISEEAPWEHFGDICISTLRKVCKRCWKTKSGVVIRMVPIVETTLTRKFYFPKLRNREAM